MGSGKQSKGGILGFGEGSKGKLLRAFWGVTPSAVGLHFYLLKERFLVGSGKQSIGVRGRVQGKTFDVILKGHAISS